MLKTLFNNSFELSGLLNLGGSRIFITALSFCSSVLIARYLNVDDLGRFALITGAFAYISIFADCGLRSAVTVEASRLQDCESLLRPYIKIRITIGIVVYLLTILLSSIFFSDKLIEIALITLSILFLAVQVDWIPLVAKNYRVAAISAVVRWVAYFVMISVAIVCSSLSINVLSIIFLLSWAVSAIASWILSFPIVKEFKTKGNLRPISSRKLFVSGVPILGSTIVSQALQNADLLWVGFRFGAESAGHYYLANSIISAGLVFANAMGQLVNAKYAKIYGDQGEMSNYLRRDFGVTVFMAAIISVSFFIVAPLAVSMIFGKNYRDSGFLVQYMLPYLILYYVWSILFYMLIALRKERELFKTKMACVTVIPVVILISSLFQDLSYLATLKGAVLIPSLFLMVKELPSESRRVARNFVFLSIFFAAFFSVAAYGFFK